VAKSILPGFPVSLSDSKTDTTVLNDNTPVPAGAQYIDGCAFSQAGSAYICPRPAGGTANQTISFIGGKAVRGDGAQIFLNGGTQNQTINGVAYTALGEMIADTTAPVRFPNGIGTSETGVASVSAIV
jgi:hypothetical protein